MIISCLPVTASAVTVDQINVKVGSSKVWLNMQDDETEIKFELSSIPVTGVTEPNDVILVIDRSGSMSADMDNMKKAAKNFVNSLNMTTHRVGIVSYDDRAESVPITNDKSALCDYIDTLTARGGTYIERGIEEAEKLLKNKRSGVKGSIVLMTDGETVNQAAAVKAAETAKNNGNFFYTVALCQNEYSTANINLKKMATSEADHYSVFYSSGLDKVYGQIAKKIGKCNPKDLVIKQTINSSFEYVPGSADNNIPRPTVSGNTLTWKMNQLGEGVATLSYKVRGRSGATIGRKPVSNGKITYTDCNGSTASVDFPIYNLELKNNPPEITSVTADGGKLSTGATVTVKGKYFQPNGIRLRLNQKDVDLLSATDSELKFIMPAVSAENSILTVYNQDGQSADADIEAYLIPVLSKISPTDGDELTKNTVRIYGSGFEKDVKKITVLVGGKTATVTKAGTTILISTPDDLEDGVHDVTVINSNGESATLPAAYTANPVYKPANPVIKDAVPGDSKVTLTWGPVPRAVKYRIYTFDNNNNKRIKGSTKECSYVAENLLNGTEYGFGIEIYANGFWIGNPQKTASATPVSLIPPPPEKAEITNISANGTTVTVTWEPVSGAKKYRIYFYSYKTKKFESTKVESSGDATSTDRILKSGCEYGIWVEPYTTTWAGKPDPKTAAFDCYTMP